MDLLKLHSVTYKLLDRMDRVEKVEHHFYDRWCSFVTKTERARLK